MRVPKSYFALALWCLCSLAGSAQEMTSAETQALRPAPQGSVLTLNNIWSHQRDLPPVPLKINDARGPQLLLSDKPEYFQTGNGISLQEEVKPGLVRLYIYHVPQPDAGPKTISAVIQNLGKRPLKFRFLRRAFPKPNRDYHLVAKTGLIQFFDSHPDETLRRIPPGGRMVMDPDMDATTVTTGELVHGFYEFKINQPARISVFERDPGQSSIAILDQLPKLPRDLPGYEGSGAGRGLFLKSDYDVTAETGFAIDTTNGPMRLLLADGRKDGWIWGHDSIAGMDDGRDSGNYGVIYRVRLKYRSSDGRGLALFITKPSRGGSSNRPRGFWKSGRNGAHPKTSTIAQSENRHIGDHLFTSRRILHPHTNAAGAISALSGFHDVTDIERALDAGIGLYHSDSDQTLVAYFNQIKSGDNPEAVGFHPSHSN